MRASVLLTTILAALGAAAPLSAANHLGPLDTNALHLNVLAYHPLPDEKGDPWGLPLFQENGTGVDWMRGYYGSFFFPTAVIDGTRVLESVPEGQATGPFNETYSNYRAAVEDALREESAVEIRIEARTTDEGLDANVTFAPTGLLSEAGLVARLVVFEDDVPYNGGNGITHHRFTVRGQQGPEPLDLSGGASSRLGVSFPLPQSMSRERLGLVAIVQNTDDSSRVFEPKEVLQSATWTARQDGPTVQHSKAALLELYSATWCEACVYGDTAADQLAGEMGLASSRHDVGAFEYLRPGPLWQAGMALLAGTGTTFLLLRPRRRAPPTDPGGGAA